MELFKILGTLAINGASEAQNDIEGTSEKASNFTEKLKIGISTAAKWGTAIVGGATAAGAALVAFASKSAATADNIDKMSQKIGISREAYQELDFICSQSGTSVDTLQAGIKSLTSAMDGAASGTASNVEQFEKLGVAVTDADGNLRSQEDVMWETMSALQGMENQTEKARLATELFGRSGTELMPLLNGEAGSLEEMKQQAHELGLVLSDELVDNGVNLTDAMDQMKRSFGSIITQLGAALMPTLEKLCDYITAAMPQIQSAMTQLEPVLSSLFESILPPLVSLAETLFPVIMSLITALVPIISEVLNVIVAIAVPAIQSIVDWLSQLGNKMDENGITAESVFSAIGQAFSDCFEVLSFIWDTVGKPIFDFIQSMLKIVYDAFAERMPAIQEATSQAFADIQDIWENNLKPCFEAIGNFIENVLAPAFEFVFKSVIGPVIDFTFNFISGLWNNSLKPIFTGIIDFITGVFSGNWKKAWDGIVSVFKGIFGGIVNIAKTPINAVISILNSFINGLNQLKIPDWVPVVGGKGISIPNIPLLESGGVLEKGQTGFLEGNGAEAVVPLENNKKWIHAVAQDINAEFGGRNNNDAVIKKLDELIKAIMSLRLYLNNDVLVGELAPAMDAALGDISMASMRGQ